MNVSLARHIALAFVAAVFISVAVYPEIFLAFKTSFLRFNDYALEYMHTALIVSFISQGGIQLWDQFGQVPFSHLFSTMGTFKFPNVLDAVAFWVLSPLSPHTGELFHHVFAWIHLFTLLFLRTFGTFLLLNCFTKDRRLATAATVIFAVFYCQAAFMTGSIYQSLYPLLVYFILRFIDTFRLRYLAAAFSFQVIASANSPLQGGYLYQGAHCLIVSSLVWSLVCRGAQWKALAARVRAFDRRQWNKAVVLAAMAVLILGPYVWMQRSSFRDAEFMSGQGGIGWVFNPGNYFQALDLRQVDLGALLARLLDFTEASGDAFFCGFMLFFLGLAGLVLSRDNRKWIFLASILQVYLLNSPKKPAFSVWPYLLFPLVILGLDELRALWRGRKSVDGPKWKLLLVLAAMFAAASFWYLPRPAGHYLGLSWTGVTIAGMLVLGNRHKWQRLGLVVLAALVIVDVVLIGLQSKRLLEGFQRAPYAAEALSPQGPIGIDFENPTLLPLREQGAVNSSDKDALISQLGGLPQNYFKFSNFMLNFVPLKDHTARHKSFAGWINDPEMALYLSENHQIIFQAGYAVRNSEGMLAKITRAQLARDVVAVDDPSGALKLPADVPRFYDAALPPEVDFRRTKGRLEDGKPLAAPEGLKVYSFPLPKDFPPQLATTVFTEDREFMHLYFEKPGGKWEELAPSQGEFVRGYTFDVNHVRKGTLNIAVPEGEAAPHLNYTLLYAAGKNEGVAGIWKKQYDNLGLNYVMRQDGWFVLQYPYDTQWRMIIDGKPVDYYRVNKSFIGFPLKAGEHKLQLQYGPGSLLRPWLFVSVVLSTLGLIVLLLMALKWEIRNG